VQKRAESGTSGSRNEQKVAHPGAVHLRSMGERYTLGAWESGTPWGMRAVHPGVWERYTLVGMVGTVHPGGHGGYCTPWVWTPPGIHPPYTTLGTPHPPTVHHAHARRYPWVRQWRGEECLGS